MAIAPFKITDFGTNRKPIYDFQGNYTAVQGHRFWYQMKAHIRLPISD